MIGLALQNAVGGVISGLLLLFEQPFKIGDWLDAAGVRGRVVEVNWRAVHIDTGSGIQIVPNSSLSGASFTNLSEPEGPYSAEAAVTFSTDDPPHEVMALLVEVADSLPMRLQRERASVDYSGGGAYSVSIPVVGPADASRALSMYLSWLWYAARRRSFALDGDSTDPLAEPQRLVEAMQEIAPTLHLRDDDIEAILSDARLERYGVGEIVLPQRHRAGRGARGAVGRAVLALEVDDGRVDFAAAEKGDLIGQTALTRERTQAVTVAGEILTVVVLPLTTIDALIRTRAAPGCRDRGVARAQADSSGLAARRARHRARSHHRALSASQRMQSCTLPARRDDPPEAHPCQSSRAPQSPGAPSDSIVSDSEAGKSRKQSRDSRGPAGIRVYRWE